MRFTKKYLEYVIESHGRDQIIKSSNCYGEKPTRPGDYVIIHGRAGDLYDALLKDEQTKTKDGRLENE